MNLNSQQQQAFDELINFLTSKTKNVIYCLKGYAGTGKTYTISRVIEEIQMRFPRWRIAVTAPTNKAVQVIREASNLSGVTYKTIHSLHGLKENITDSGEIEFTKDWNESDSSLKNINVLIVDEISMINDELFFATRRYNNDCKIIFMGDPAQIPPVGKEDCEPFLNPEEHGIVEIQLTEIMRQAKGSYIAQAGQTVRENLDRDGFNFATNNDLLVRNMPEDREQLIADFREAFTSDRDVRVIAWTNRKVAEYNRYIRTLLHGEAPGRLIKHERLIMNKPFSAKVSVGDTFEFIPLSANQEVFVKRFKVIEKNIETVDLQLYDTEIKFVDRTGKNRIGWILILNEASDDRFKQHLDVLKATAINSRFDKRKECWKRYYDFLRSVADVSYAYALTAHKSQGSTYDQCFVDLRNIQLNDNVVERNRILYTAITRAKSKLILVQ